MLFFGAGIDCQAKQNGVASEECAIAWGMLGTCSDRMQFSSLNIFLFHIKF